MLTGVVPFTGDTPVAVAMRHVREDVPDVQLRRPEVSASTAAVVDRATAKDLDRRYPDIPALVGDLEEALAIEASRSGQATGEVTSVLRTLPGSARRRLPWRMLHPSRWVISLAVVLALAAVVLVILASNTHRGTGVAPDVVSKPGLTPVALGQTAAHSYNPFGTGPEHRTEVSNVVDGDPNSLWSSEHYLGGAITGKPGLGLYVDAAPGVAARAVEIQTPAPGFSVAIYGAQKFDETLGYGNTEPLAERGWQALATAQPIRRGQTTIDFAAAATRYRFYLVWITKLAPHRETAEISELTLFR